MDDTAAEQVCGAEDIGSCVTEFKKEHDEVLGINNWEVYRGCNGKPSKKNARDFNPNLLDKDMPQDVREESHKRTSYWCIDSMCNNDPLSGSFYKMTANFFLLVFFLLQ